MQVFGEFYKLLIEIAMQLSFIRKCDRLTMFQVKFCILFSGVQWNYSFLVINSFH